MAEQQARTGKKISAEEAKSLDPAKRAVLISGTPEAAEVEGQEHIRVLATCPWCSLSGWVVTDTDHYHWITCGRCGHNFQV